MIIRSVAHLDHTLHSVHLSFILKMFGGRQSFFIETVEMPTSFRLPATELDLEIPEVQLGLYGPLCGDDPVLENDVTYAVRGVRSCASRMTDRPARMTRQLTIIAGPHEGEPCVLYTAYGGPAAPREPGDTSIESWEDIVSSREFWKTHALVRSIYF